MTLLQGGSLPDHRAYLDRCSTVRVFKSKKYLSGLEVMPTRIKINCNTGSVSTKQMGNYRRMKVWYIPDGIANIISIHEPEKLYQITYDSWEGYYIVHTAQGQVHFHKDEQGLPYIDLEQLGCMAVIMLMQNASQQLMEPKGMALVQTVRENYEDYTKREVLRAKEAHCAQALIGNLSEGDFKGMVSSNMIKNCSITPSDIAAKEIFGPALASV